MSSTQPAAPPPARSGLPRPILSALYLQPLVTFAAGYAAGVAVAPDATILGWWPLALAAALLPALWKARQRPLSLVVGLFSAALLFGLARGRFSFSTAEPDEVSSLATGQEALLEGWVSEPPEPTRHGVRFELEVARQILSATESEHVRGRVMVHVPEAADVRYGDYVRLRAKLRPPRNFRTPGSFDFARRLRLRNIHVVGTVANARHIALLDPAQSGALHAWFESRRNDLDRLLTERFSPESVGLAKAFLIGRRDDLRESDVDAMRRSGVVHIASISGLHMVVVAAAARLAVMWILAAIPYLALRLPVRELAAAAALGPTVFYLLLSGAEPPALRSALLTLLTLLALLIGRTKEPLHALAVVALILLAAKPLLLFDLSFQLTFLSVLGILLAHRTFPWPAAERDSPPPIWHRPLKWTYLGVVTSVGALLMSAPVILHAFNLFSPVSILSNLLVAPAASAAVIVLLALTPAALLGFQIPDVAFSAAALPIEVLLKLSQAFARLPGASLYLPTPSPLELVLLFGLAFGLLLIRRQAGRVLAIAALLTLAIDLGVTWIGRPPDGRMTAVFLDVGQGDAAWVELPDGKTLLIDTGGGFDQNFDVGRNVIARFLWDRRHASVDIVALSHPHPDHVDGARFILEHFPVGELWTGLEFPGPDGYGADLLDIARRKGVVHRVLKAGEVALEGGETTIRVLAPPENLWDDVNDNSIVLRIDFGDTAFLFPGDIGARAERWVWLSDHPMRADVLKVPHHGSNTSTSREFLASVSPRFAVISAGLHNRYGLPDEEVISRLEDSGAAVFRTDESGTIEIVSDGRSILSAGPAIGR